MSSTPNLTPPPATNSAPAPKRPGKSNGAPAWWIVAKREIGVKLRDKAFIIGTLSTVGLMALAALLGALLAPKPADTATLPVAAVEEKATVMVQAVAAQAQKSGDLEIQLVPATSADAAKAALQDGAVDVYLEADGPGWKVWTREEPNSTFNRLLEQTLQEQLKTELSQRSGVSVEEINAQMSVATDVLAEPSQSQFVGLLVGLAFALIFMLSAMIYGMQIATSVIEEKQSRIVEILVSAIPVRHLLFGKILGISIIAIAQTVILLAAALIGISFTPISHMLPEFIRSSAWFLLFFIAGFIALATLWAAAGALGTRSEDLNQTSQPLIWVLMIAYLFGFMSTGTTRVIASFVPIVSAILMPARIAEGDVAWWETLLALALNIAFAAITIYVGSKIYRRALLQTGGRLSYRQALKLSE